MSSITDYKVDFDFATLNNAQLRELLDKERVVYDSKAKKPDLVLHCDHAHVNSGAIEDLLLRAEWDRPGFDGSAWTMPVLRKMFIRLGFDAVPSPVSARRSDLLDFFDKNSVEFFARARRHLDAAQHSTSRQPRPPVTTPSRAHARTHATSPASHHHVSNQSTTSHAAPGTNPFHQSQQQPRNVYPFDRDTVHGSFKPLPSATVSFSVESDNVQPQPAYYDTFVPCGYRGTSASRSIGDEHDDDYAAPRSGYRGTPAPRSVGNEHADDYAAPPSAHRTPAPRSVGSKHADDYAAPPSAHRTPAPRSVGHGTPAPRSVGSKHAEGYAARSAYATPASLERGSAAYNDRASVFAPPLFEQAPSAANPARQTPHAQYASIGAQPTSTRSTRSAQPAQFAQSNKPINLSAQISTGQNANTVQKDEVDDLIDSFVHFLLLYRYNDRRTAWSLLTKLCADHNSGEMSE